MAYQKIEPKNWKPETQGDCIEGTLTAKAPSLRYPETQQYGLLTIKGENFTIFGSTILDDRMEHVNVGNKIKMVFNGLIKNKKGQDTKTFDVFVDDGKPEVIKVNP